jgi:DNA gyrase subunit A
MPDENLPLQTAGNRLIPINVIDEMKNSFLDYSMSVIISRALPDVRDGLKPSQRRILYAMSELGLQPNKKPLKCAKIVGETMGNYHPHGDQAIYPTLVHMAQPWAMREPLIDGQGNFGSIEGDPPAAMRYTEARLTPLGSLLMQDMDQDTVDFAANYDETRTEPTVFPAAFPNLLVNGSTGIAVGMATNIPPHNFSEIIDGTCAIIDNPKIAPKDLMKIIKGPDFPTGCEILGREGIRNYFTTGRGSIKVRGKVQVEEMKNGRQCLIITEIPFNVNRAELVSRIAELVNTKVLTDISDVRDESDAHTRVVVELKRDAIAKIVINNLYNLTSLQTSFAANTLAIDHGRPKTLTVKDILVCYIEHRREVILRRTRFQLRKAEDRAEQLEAYLVALANLDEFIKIIRSAKDRAEAKEKLKSYRFPVAAAQKFGITITNNPRLSDGYYILSDRQLDAILELRLYQLTGLERDKVIGEYEELLKTIADLLDILDKESRVLAIIKQELQTIKTKHGSPRRTSIVADEGEMQIEDLVANEGVIITLTHKGLIKRTETDAFRSQKRGGRGVIGATAEEGDQPEDSDFVEHLFTASTHDYLMFFTNTGRVYVERVFEIPEMSRTAKGRNIANLLELRPDEKIATMIRIEYKRSDKGDDITWDSNQYVFFATKLGTVKKTPLKDYANIRKGGIIAIGIDPGDALIGVRLTSGDDDVLLITREGMSIRFHESDVRSMGRQAAGVKGITLENGDQVVSADIVDPQSCLLVAGENGIGKRTAFDEYRLQSRGGKGIITMKTTEKTGKVIGALAVRDEDEIMLITEKGLLVRTRVREIRAAGRNTQGVKLINLEAEDKLLAMAPVINDKTTNQDLESGLLPTS